MGTTASTEGSLPNVAAGVAGSSRGGGNVMIEAEHTHTWPASRPPTTWYFSWRGFEWNDGLIYIPTQYICIYMHACDACWWCWSGTKTRVLWRLEHSRKRMLGLVLGLVREQHMFRVEWRPGSTIHCCHHKPSLVIPAKPGTSRALRFRPPSRYIYVTHMPTKPVTG